MIASTNTAAAEKSNEIELKLLTDREGLNAAARHPSLSDIRDGVPRVLHMRTVYYDTPDQLLASHGVALRIRTDAQRHRQMLKTLDADSVGQSGAISTRREWQWELPNDQPDISLIHKAGLTEIADLLSQNEIVPLFISDIKRTLIDVRPAPSTHIEIAIDHGHIITSDEKRDCEINEIELELVSGHAGYLYDLAMDLAEDISLRVNADSKAGLGYRLATGAQPAPCQAQMVSLVPTLSVADGFRYIARSCIRHLLANEQCACATPQSDNNSKAIRQMRMAIRQLRTLLQIFRPALAGKAVEHYEAELKWLYQELATKRDWDIVLNTARHKRYASSLLPAFQKQKELSDIQSISAIQSPRYARLILSFSAWIESPDWHKTSDIEKRAIAEAPLAKHASQWLQQLLDDVLSTAGPPKEMDNKKRHELRKALKRFYDGVVFFNGLYPQKKYRKLQNTLLPILDCLGSLNDMATTRKKAKKLLSERPTADKHESSDKQASDNPAALIASAKKLRQKLKQKMARTLDDNTDIWDALCHFKPYWN